MIQSPSSLLSYILQNHHLAHFHVLSMLARLVRPIIPFPSPMLMILLLPHKSNPFFCPSHRSSLPRRAKPPPYPSLLVPFVLPCLIAHQPPSQPLSHSHHNHIIPPSHYITSLHHPPTPSCLTPIHPFLIPTSPLLLPTPRS